MLGHVAHERGASQVMIPVREGRTNEPLRYAARAWATHHPELEVVIIGGRPDWWAGRHLPTVQESGHAAQWAVNFPRALRAAVESATGPFWWSADDIFPLAALPDPPVTWCRRQDLDAYVAAWQRRRPPGYTGLFVAGMAGQRDILRAQGVTTQHNADIHLPHLLEPWAVATLLDLLATEYPEHPAGHFRAIYGGLWPGRIERVADPKVTFHGTPDTSGGWVSTCGPSWRSRAGKLIRSHYPKPSPYEKESWK